MKAEIFNHSEWLSETEPNKLKTFFDMALSESEFMVCDYVEKNFKPFGYTGLWLLAESHFAIHTFPEANKTYIEISSCSFEKHVKFMGYLQRGKAAGLIS